MLPENHGRVGYTVSRRSNARDFWRFFKLWAGITAIPCLLVYSQTGIQHVQALPVLLAPAVVFGTIGATVMTFLVTPGHLLRALLAGMVVGFGLPAAVFWGLVVILPKNEASLGYYLAGWVLGMAGGVAGVIAGSWRGSEGRL
jgi:hypothetical protein